MQGTNLQHALILAGRFLDKHPDCRAGRARRHRRRADRAPAARRPAVFAWPPEPETLELTLAEVDQMTRRGATLNVFMLDDDPRLTAFVQELARRNGGRVFSPTPDGSASTS